MTRDGEGTTDRRQILRLGTGMAAAATAGVLAAGAGQAAGADPILAPLYLPAPPMRVYDSREAGGRIVSGRTRTIVPLVTVAPILAWGFNVTVTDTVGAGFLSVFPGNRAWTGSSSINWWASGQTIANNALTPCTETDHAIRVYCGGGNSTQFVLDLVAAILMADLTTMSDPDLLSGAAFLGTDTGHLGAQVLDES